MRRVVPVIMAALLAAGCSATGSTSVPGNSTATPAAVASATPAASTAPEATAAPTDTPEPTASPPPAGPVQYKPGDVITITQDDSPWATVVVSKVTQATSYKAQYYTDKPKTAGDVFIQAYVSYTALVDGVSYNPFDWQVFANGEAVQDLTILMNGPTPTLSSGTLPKGRKASGWVVYEVPAKGQVLLSFRGNMFSTAAPVFEVVLRAK